MKMTLHLKSLVILASLSLGMDFPSALSFSCFTCNTGSADDDTRPCVEKAEECPEVPAGVHSCSTILYFSKKGSPGQPHMRKFCTSPGMALGTVLERLPLKRSSSGAGLCQSVDKWIAQEAHMSPSPLPDLFMKARKLIRRINRLRASSSRPEPPTPADESELQKITRKRREAAVGSAPAPPNSHSSTLLCVCAQPGCNKGDFQEVLDRSVLGDNFEQERKSRVDANKVEKIDEPAKKVALIE